MKEFQIVLNNGNTFVFPSENIKADYIRVENGHLTLRRNGAAGDYPETVRVFAPGSWRECKLVESDCCGPSRWTEAELRGRGL